MTFKQYKNAYIDAVQLLTDIMNDAVNPQDEAEKWLRAWAPHVLRPRPSDLTYEISEDRSTLTIIASPAYMEELQEECTGGGRYWGTAAAEIDLLEPLISNSELQWIYPDDTGDLTDAPLLGIVGGDDTHTREQTGPFGCVCAGCDRHGNWYAPILERWGFESYQVRSFLDDLRLTGKAKFINSW